MFQKTRIPIVTIAVLALALGACGEDPSSPPGGGDSVAAYVASVSVDATEGELQTHQIPRPTTGGPAIDVDGHLTVVNGGTTILTVTAPTPFSRIYVAASTPISEIFVPVSGFYQVDLPAPTQAAELLITFPQSLPPDDFELYVAAEDAAGNVGTLAERTFNPLSVGTGDIQVTVAWDNDSDVDLHVVDPSGTEIYWANRTSASGGQLDLDSNAACSTDGVRNENITWATGTAPQGTYTVRVDYWSSCNFAQTRYTVLVNNGGDVEVFRGTFQGPGDSGGLGSGQTITTFTRTTGPQAPPARRLPSGSLPVGPTTK